VATVPAFRWEAVDAQGRVKQGVLEAESPRAARDRLRAEGLTPTAVSEAVARSDWLPNVRLPAPLITLTTRQLATLVQAGMPLDQALVAVAEQADDARAAKLIAAVRTHVATGEALPMALARYPRTFSPLYRGLVGAGAETGRLADVLARPAESNSRLYHLRRFFYDCAQSSNPIQMQGLKTLVGVSQIVLGSDYPFGSPGKHITGLSKCGFTADELRSIFRENALRILPKFKS